MDDHFAFYKHNQYLTRFLIGSTALFLGVIAIVWWQGRHTVGSLTSDTIAIKKFSDTATVSSFTKEYEFAAQHITDIESVPGIKERFLTTVPPEFLYSSAHAAALTEVREATRFTTEYGTSQVYNTSYYIGNLLVSPRLSLHELLLANNRPPYTTMLLETALSDIRAGVVKIQNYHDVAPPDFYQATRTSTLYFPTPSFPSLTVSEAAMVLSLLATVDRDRAPLYEYMLEEYASHVFAAGVHFRSDIEAALMLVGEYLTVMRDTPEYQALFLAAAAEWKNEGAAVIDYDIDFVRPFSFTLHNFPALKTDTPVSVRDYGYSTEYQDEVLGGDIRLSLVDMRVSPRTLRLYEYDVATNAVLPVDVDLKSSGATDLGTSVGFARCVTNLESIFVSGTYTAVPETIPYFSAARFFTYNQTTRTVQPLAGGSLENFSATALSPSENCTTAALIQRVGEESGKISLRSLTDETVREEFLGTSPTFISSDMVAFVRDGLVYQKEIGSNDAPRVVPSLGDAGTDFERSISYAPEQAMMVVIDRVQPQRSLIPYTTVTLYRKTSDMTFSKVYEIEFAGRRVATAMLSPAQHYLAVVSTRSVGGREGELLIFDINSGIIKRVVDLSAFSPRSLFIDAWVN